MNIISSVFVIVGAIIGAGFASGKEIYTFFYAYGTKGILGIFISIFLIGLMIYKSLEIIKKYNINNYNEFLEKITKNNSEKIKIFLNSIINIFLLIVFFVMCAGFAAFFNQEFGINQIYSGLIIAIICYIILNKNIKGIILFNFILIPLIIIILFLLGIKNIEIIKNINFNFQINNLDFLPKAILYASYNSITLISILIPMKKYIKNKKTIFIISFLSSIIIIILAIIIFSLLLNIKTNVNNIELPAVYASRTFWRNI